MADLKYPIGIQTFSKIIEGGWTYVDKTHFIASLVEKSQYVFLSRPRRFGKSLFLSTLKAYFEGRRDLFRGLALDSADVDWTPSPVLYFDFNPENYSLEDGLELRLDTCLSDYEEIYGRRSEDSSPAQRLNTLIRLAYEQTGQRVVILIDEYDKPLLGLQDNEGLFDKSQKILKSVFGNLKSMDSYIRFAFITGVARFSKISIFSDLNNLDDISMDEEYAEICGLTEQELTSTFGAGIEELAKARGEDYETTLDVVRDYYDGYRFSPHGARLYNPFSVLNAMKKKAVAPYWFESGTPTFLVRLIRTDHIDPTDINGRRCSIRALMQVGLGTKDPIPLMFQAGYLTIDTYDSRYERCTLRFPNREVEKAFAENLLPLYIKK